MNRDELVEHLYNEIANRDERIGELENEASYYASRYEDVREELEALKAANLDLQIHFNTMKAELEGVKLVIPERMDYHDYLNLYDKGEAIGHNNAIGQIIRLNPNLTLRVIK